MSKYTTELRFLCEMSSGMEGVHGFNDVNAVLSAAAPRIFNFDFPIFDEAYRNVLEIKILKHYYTRELAEETVGLWKLRLDAKLNEIMPYYNKLYKSELLEFNPFYDVDYTRTNDGHRNDVTSNEDEGTSTSTGRTTNNRESTDKNNRWDVYSDTPQGSLQNVQNETYLTNARKIIDDGSGSVKDNGTDSRSVNTSNSGTGKLDSTSGYVEHIVGKMGTQSYNKLLEEFRKNLINIDMMVIDELEPLFFGLW